MTRELSEIKIIEIFRKHLETQPHIYMGVKTPSGIYEDAGVIRLDNGKLLVVTTDLIGRKTHVPEGMSFFQMGSKAVVVNISDLAAMGAEPLGLVFSVGMPKEIQSDDIEEIARGMNFAAKNYGTCVFGGDMNKTDDIILAGTAIGLSSEDRIFLRNGAKENDIVAVTDWIGGAAVGLKALKNHLSIEKALLERIMEPQARLKEALELNKLKAITAAGDITDGLAFELHKICEASKKGVIIEEEKLPIREDVKEFAYANGLDPIALALYIGEDFELLFTISPERWDQVKTCCKKINLQITEIGRIISDPRVIMKSQDGKQTLLRKEGYDQFKTIV